MTESNRIIIAGGTGFIGSAVAKDLAAGGRDVVILTRTPRHPSPIAATVREVHWDGRSVGPWLHEVNGAAAVINLAGKNVNCRYTKRALAEIDQSRVDAVRAMGEAIALCVKPPRVLVQASTTAIYGNRGDLLCDEAAPIGEGIPVDTATKWETAFHAAATPDTRRVLLRIGFVLGPSGGVLAFLATLTRCFLGGTAGAGTQYISWIHLDDLVRVITRATDDDAMEGLYIAATPNPSPNAAFMRELRRVLHRPWSPPVPSWAVRVGCVLMRTEPVLALTGRRCVPRRLMESGFEFRFPRLPEALHDTLATPGERTTLAPSPRYAGERAGERGERRATRGIAATRFARLRCYPGGQLKLRPARTWRWS